jgi:hypothetical protein
VLRSRVLLTIKRSPVMVLSMLAPIMLLPSPAVSSGNSALRYDYEFKGTHGTVTNSAPTGPAAHLTLYGNWTAVPDGVHFSGNTSGKASVAYGRPAKGATMNAPATEAVGLGTRIVYNAPASGACFGDTPNITQIGRYSLRGPSGQVKIQLSSCAESRKKVVMECRFAGSLTAPHAPPVASTLPLINGDAYNVGCRKSPDQANNTATITLTVTRLNGGHGGKTVTNTFTVPALGSLRTRAYFSVGNKYPLPPPAKNTDQFKGDVTRAVYCAGSVTRVRACLAAHLPAS